METDGRVCRLLMSLSVGTHMDANGDGIGDFQGLMRRLLELVEEDDAAAQICSA